MAGKIFIGDYGVVVRVSTGVDLTGATSLKIKVIKPNGVEATWTAAAVSPVTSGDVTYTTALSDFNVAGTYKIQAEVTFTSSKFLGETTSFRVYDKWQ
jgi:hypothetical protein